jgi:predicted ATP-dependent endonuclease of OLD family
MNLRAIHLTGFCGFKDFGMEFGNSTILIGPNNGGKTTILRAIKLVFTALQSENYLRALKQAYDQLVGASLAHQAKVREITENQTAAQPSRVEAQIRAAEQHLAQTYKSISQQLRNITVDLPALARSQGLANFSSFVFGHDLRAGFKIELTLAVADNEVRVIATFADQKFFLDVRIGNKSLLTEIDPNNKAIFDTLLNLKVEFVPPISAALVASEHSLAWPQIKQRLADGRDFEVWRNRIHWLSEGKHPQRYQRVIDRIRTSLADVSLNAPGRTKDPQPNVILTYEEDGSAYDVSESGAGFRTLLGLATTIELSDADIMLLDEPDSHLHSSVQKQVAEFLISSASKNRQIIVSTHAPDMIEEFPLEALFWIDRRKNAASPADSVSETLVALGVANHRQAFHLLDAKAHLYFENKPDQRILSRLSQRCGLDGLLKSARAIRLRGAGDAKHLPTFARLVESHFKKRIPMAAILDADYEVNGDPTTDGLLLTARLPCKELENLLLLQPKAIFDRLVKAAELAGRSLDLTLNALDSLIDSETLLNNITDTVRLNWISKRCPPDRRPDAGELRKLEEDFERTWADPQFRRRFCPGKQVLTNIKRKIQEATGLSFTNDSAFDFYEPPDDVRRVLDAVDDHIQKLLSENTAPVGRSEATDKT